MTPDHYSQWSTPLQKPLLKQPYCNGVPEGPRTAARKAQNASAEFTSAQILL